MLDVVALEAATAPSTARMTEDQQGNALIPARIGRSILRRVELSSAASAVTIKRIEGSRITNRGDLSGCNTRLLRRGISSCQCDDSLGRVWLIARIMRS